MFCKILQENHDLAKELLELILDISIRELREISQQHVIESHPETRAVRFDVYVEDDQNRVFDIEMQTIHHKNLIKRSRYYTSSMDQEQLDRGQDYKNLPDSYVIFICTFNLDPTRMWYRYSFENMCLEDPTYQLHDGTHKIFLCTDRANDLGISDELKDFLDFVAGNSPTTDFTQRLSHEVKNAKKRGRWRREYMDSLEREEFAREEGRKEGLVEGHKNGLAEGHKNGLAEGRKEAVKLFILDKLEDQIPADVIEKKLIKHFQMSPEEAAACILECSSMQ
ncbi:MAG: Rpn family recombination-promoting nuclease/putative transposase [Eubacteriales bacterium]|nr:Rpn family recombination-promoting nuclease/putative transposase [Eubacteriales bacterium]